MDTHIKQHINQIKEIIESISILSLQRFKVNNEEHHVYYQQAYQNFNEELSTFGKNNSIDDTLLKQHLKEQLTNKIYSRFYCGISKENEQLDLPSKSEREDFMKMLSAANTTNSLLDYNWLVYAIDPTGNVYIKKNEELRWLDQSKFEFADKNQKKHTLNSYVNLKKERENTNLQPVFYHAFSNEIFPQDANLVRIYWNIAPEGIAKLLEKLTTILNDYQIPFQFKCLNHPSLYVRNDSAVLYLDKKHLDITLLLLPYIISEVKPYLKQALPWFTKSITAGVSFAEDPGNGQSFGMSRATAIAEAIVIAFEKDLDNDKALDFTLKHMTKKGLNINSLYLNNHTAKTPQLPKI